MKTFGLSIAAWLLASAVAFAQAPSPAAGATTPAWSTSISLFTYVVPDEDTFLQPTLASDHDRLHLEGRFNYEDLDTASFWVGRAYSVGGSVTFDVTPMAGAVVGNTTGGGLGYSASVAWRRLDVSSETEYVFAAGDADSFLYTWTEVGWSPAAWLRGGFAVQRTKVYETPFDIQRGFFAGVTAGRWQFSGYVFNPDADTPTVVIGVAVDF